MSLFRVFAPIFWAISLSPMAFSFDLTGTHFDRAGRAHGIDPVLIYAVALAESASGRGKDSVSPWPWTLRAPERGYYEKNRLSAEIRLEELVREHGHMIDVGLMQINLRWNGHRVSSMHDLFDIETNIMVGAEILAEAIMSSPTDLELGVGRYYTWNEPRARSYGSRVIGIYENLKAQHELQ